MRPVENATDLTGRTKGIADATSLRYVPQRRAGERRGSRCACEEG